MVPYELTLRVQIRIYSPRQFSDRTVCATPPQGGFFIAPDCCSKYSDHCTPNRPAGYIPVHHSQYGCNPTFPITSKSASVKFKQTFLRFRHLTLKRDKDAFCVGITVRKFTHIHSLRNAKPVVKRIPLLHKKRRVFYVSEIPDETVLRTDCIDSDRSAFFDSINNEPATQSTLTCLFLRILSRSQ